MVTGLHLIGQNKALQDHEIKRVFAFIVDGLIVLVLSWVFGTLLLPPAFLFGGPGVLFLGVGGLMVALIAILYWSIQEGFGGATIGKKVLGLRVVGTTGPMDLVKALVRNVTKVSGVLVLLDWIVGLATQGDPRQKFTDRFAGTTVVRTDAHAYMEEQFRQMATPPPHPMPAVGGPAPPQHAAAPGSAPAEHQPPQGWPGQQPAPGTGWPQHQWDEEGRLIQQPRFCSSCGGPLVPRGDGRLVCSRCGAVY